MDRNRLINLGIVGAIALVALFGWMLGVSPVLDQTTAAKTQQAATATANDASEARLVTMKKQFANLPALPERVGWAAPLHPQRRGCAAVPREHQRAYG